MVRDDLHISVPTYFRCPISLDVMKSPVSLCTGVTYDRSSIQRWLDGGNNTCPATMLLLQNKELIPNHTLQRLINIWSDSVLTRPPNSLTRERVTQLLDLLNADLHKNSHHFVAQSLSTLTSFAAESEENANFLAAVASQVLPVLVSVIGNVRDLSCMEKIVLFCNLVLKNIAKTDSDALRSRIDMENLNFKSAILMSLKQQGKLQLRIAVARFLELMASNMCIEINCCSISEEAEFQPELLRLMTTSDPEAADASLSLLTRLARLKRNRSIMVRAGGVTALAAALVEAEMNAACTEKVLKLLEMVTGCNEGRKEMCADDKCVGAVVRKLLKVSSVATEHAVTVLWSLCCLYGDKRAAAAVVRSDGMAKILVVLQSNCTPMVRRMCADLLRVMRCNSKRSCVSWYDTKTTHIMPF